MIFIQKSRNFCRLIDVDQVDHQSLLAAMIDWELNPMNASGVASKWGSALYA
jgi:hypothetical protein